MSADPISARASPLGLAASLLTILVVAVPAAAQDASGGVNDLLMLTTSPPEVAKDADYGLLLREIGRQALLIAARDHLHLPTRDEAIGDPVPPAARPFDVSVLVRPRASYRLRLSRDGEVAWEKEVTIDPRGKGAVDVDQLVEKFEALSRGEMVAALKKAGLSPRAAGAHVAGARLAGETESLLWQMTFLAQFEAVRQAHARIRTAGESPELLGALVRGYANLGQLLRFLWCPAHKAFEARSLLYAQRMVALHPKDATALYHRAYARATVGLHASALKDLDAADALAKKGGVEAAGAGVTPAWADLVRALCRYDTAKLNDAAAAGGNAAPLASYFAFLTVQNAAIQVVEVNAARAALQANPECLRLIDALCDRTGVGPLNELTETGPVVFGLSLGKRLEAMSLPQRVKDELARQRQAAAAPPARRVTGPLADTHISPARPAVIQLLIESGDIEQDDGEPSVAALGSLLREVTFVHVRRRADLIARRVGRDAGPYCAVARPLVTGHPFAPLIDAYGLYYHNAPGVWGRPLKGIQPKDAEPNALLYWDLMRLSLGFATNPGSPYNLALNSTDDGAWDLERSCIRLSRPKGNADLPDHLKRLKEVSPHSPVFAAVTIKADWATAEKQLPRWERELGDHPAVAGALAWKYLVLKRYDDAERWAKRYLQLAPEAGSYMMLAEAYRLRGDDDAWVNTVEQYLAQEQESGLTAAKVRVRIAEHLLGRGKAEQAVPHAELAAASGAQWARNCASIANERAGHWDAAERWVVENVRSYGIPESYYTWCVRTGRGNVEAARAAALTQAEAVRPSADRESLARAAGFYLIDGKTPEALAALRVLYGTSGDPWAGLHAALLAPDDATRDEALAAVLAKRNPPDPETAARPWLVEFAQWLKDNRAAGGDKALDLKAVDKITAKCVARPADAANIDYLTAKFLQKHAREEEATAYLRRAAAMVLVEAPGTGYALAWKELRAKGIDPEKLPPEPPPGHNELVPEIRRDE